ncbi:MAG TPA: alpha/beta fold hydrolase [Polyangiaceae bacterium]|jgi:pimeloyl-ACP methyl ester carboxylesterase|nr:alpha/beta fold hydrolase [Polyangiaceae bacterium]
MAARRALASIISVAALASLTGCSGAPSQGDAVGVAASTLTRNDVTFDVKVRGTGTVSIHASVFVNDKASGLIDVLAVHGLAETGYTFAPLAQAIFADRVAGRRVRRIVAIDLPGHGDSGFPTGLPTGVHFGDLKIEDNVDVLLQVIDGLAAKRLYPRIIIGHSMGGLEVQAAQQTLLSRGSSFAAHGITGAILLAPVPPHGRPWSPAVGDSTPFIVNDPTLGSYLSLPPAAFVAQALSTPAGQIVSDAPTPDEVTANHYSGPEPLTTLLQLVESPIPTGETTTTTIPRPTVNNGALSVFTGTLTTIASFSEDVLVPPADLADLYTYLTFDRRALLYRAVTADDAVHATYISNPDLVVEALRPML